MTVDHILLILHKPLPNRTKLRKHISKVNYWERSGQYLCEKGISQFAHPEFQVKMVMYGFLTPWKKDVIWMYIKWSGGILHIQFTSQPKFTCSKSTIETLEQRVKCLKFEILTSRYHTVKLTLPRHIKDVKIIIKTQILLWKTIERSSRLRVMVRFLLFYYELAATDPWCNMSWLGRKKYEEAISDEHPRVLD